MNNQLELTNQALDLVIDGQEKNVDWYIVILKIVKKIRKLF